MEAVTPSRSDRDSETSAADRAEAARRNPDRLAALRATGLLDSETEPAFDRLTRLAVAVLGVPAAFLSLVDEERDFYKAATGFGEPLATTRELTGPTFCHFAITSPEPLVIPDTAADPAYRDLPTVRSLGVAAYVGVPLLVGGQPVGSFCAIDTAPHPWTQSEVDVLRELAESALREVALRRANQQLEAQRAALTRANEELQAQARELEARTREAELARTEAEDANRAKSDFLAVMSHELRTPLNAISGHAELIELGIHGPVTPEQHAALERIRRSERHLLGLINGVLNYAKVDAGAVHYEVKDVPLEEVLATCEALVAPQIRAKHLRFRDTARPTGLAVRADPEKTQQVVLNLLSNAAKFTDAEGCITVTCEPHGNGTVAVSVSDTGCGIAADQLERVFQPFVQVDSRLTRTQEGTGLGLAISRDLARGMGGDVTAESTPGEGSRFTLTLPRA